MLEATSAPTAEPTEAPDPTAVPYTPGADEGEQSTMFTMPAYAVEVTAEFVKIDYPINYVPIDDNIKLIIEVKGDNNATSANMGDTVNITATPANKYETKVVAYVTSADGTKKELELTDNAGSFTMPADAVTIWARARKEAVADLLPTSYDVDSLVTIASNATQTARDGDRSVTVLEPSAPNTDTSVISNTSLNNTLKSDTPKTLYFAVDFKLAAGDVLLTRPTGGSFGTNQGPTDYIYLNDSGNIAYDHQTSSTSGYGIAKTDTGIASAAGNWYRLILSGERTDNANDATKHGCIATYDMNIYAYNADGTLNTTAAFTKTGLGGRNTSSAVNAFHVGAYAGAPVVDCVYVYTDPYYAASVTVNTGAAGSETPIEGAAVTVKKGNIAVATGTTAKTTGVFSIDKIQAGTYTVAVEKEGYAKVEDGSLTVTADGGSQTITLVEQSDTTYAVKVNTAPFATVVLNAGTSTKGTPVTTQTVTATSAGVATLADVPAGNYTVNVTSPNKYLVEKTNEPITVVDAATPVNVALDYDTTTYPNLIYGDEFNYTTTSVLFNKANATFDNWTGSFKTYGTVYTSGDANNHFYNYTQKVDGTYMLPLFFAETGTATFTTTQDIKQVEFDMAYDNMTNNNGKNDRGAGEIVIKLGGKEIVKYDASSADAAPVTAGTATIANGYEKWINVVIKVSADGKTASVTLTPYTFDAESTPSLDTANVANGTITFATSEEAAPELKTFIIESTQTTKNGSGYAGIGIDNLELYNSAN